MGCCRPVPGAITRWNGSLLYPAKIPDLIGIKDRKYIDHTATHLHRGIGDLMRYAAQVAYAELADFGGYHMLASGTNRLGSRVSDEALYALALYVYSLDPPPNSNHYDSKAQAGEKIFSREGCAGCHFPPLYTNNKVTLAQGFVPLKEDRTVWMSSDIRRNRPGPGARDAQGNRLLQDPLVARSVVSRPLAARWVRGEPRRDVRPGAAQSVIRA